MTFNEESIVWGVKKQLRVKINKIFSEIKTNIESYLIEASIYFLTEMALKPGDVDLAIRGT